MAIKNWEKLSLQQNMQNCGKMTNLRADTVKSSIFAKNAAECDVCRHKWSSVRPFRGDQSIGEIGTSKQHTDDGKNIAPPEPVVSA